MKNVIPALMALIVDANQNVWIDPVYASQIQGCRESVDALIDIHQENVHNLIVRHQDVVDDLRDQLSDSLQQSYVYESSNQECRSVNARLEA